jgi:UPF0716 protein FxsA
MFVVIVALLVIVPLAELAALIVVSQWIGVLPAIALLAVVSLLGLVLVKQQGVGAWRRIRAEIRGGEVPAAAAVDGALVLVAGTLLLVPGFLTDIVGLCLLAPPVRDLIRRFTGRRLSRRVRTIDAVSSEMRPRPPSLNP